MLAIEKNLKIWKVFCAWIGNLSRRVFSHRGGFSHPGGEEERAFLIKKGPTNQAPTLDLMDIPIVITTSVYSKKTKLQIKIGEIILAIPPG